MPKKYTFIPWRTKDEFERIYHKLFQGDPGEKKTAIDRISSWNSRYKKLPVAIICTKDLVELQLGMPAQQNGNTSTFIMACTLAITRFVNLMTEEKQKFGRGMPVHEVAMTIGLPKWIVDIRHQGTHGHMPKHAILESALRFSLDWLKETFWEAQIKEMCADRIIQEGDFDLQTIEKLRGILSDYMDCMGSSSILVNGRPHHREREVLQKLNKPLRNHPSKKYLAYLLTQDGYLVPTPEQERALGISDGVTFPQDDNLPGSLVALWKPLLDFTVSCGLEHLIMESIINLLSRFTSGNPVEAKSGPIVRYLLGWAKHLIKRNGITQRSESTTRESPPQKKHKRDASEWSKTLKKCIEKPNKHSMELLPSLLECQDPRLEKSAEEKLVKLAETIVHGPNGMSLSTNGLPSLNDMEAMIDSKTRQKRKGNPMLGILSDGKKGAQNRTVVDSAQPWHLSDDLVDWSHTPLGVLPWQPDDPDFFQLGTLASKQSSDS
nr:ribosomal biogenesis protein LAS1L-like [Lytechinus pictus]